MKKTLFFLILILAHSVYSFSQTPTPSDGILYVKTNASGSGDGSSWENAFGNLATAINWFNTNSSYGDRGLSLQIWVASGTYKPVYNSSNSAVSDRTASFYIHKSQLSLFGGFAGNENSIFQRNITSNKTILSGDIGTSNDKSDNAYCVLYLTSLQNVSVLTHPSNSRIDGFTIKDGNTTGSSSPVTGSVTLVGSSPRFTNCTISDNEGYGITMNNAGPDFFSCVISGNSTAIYSYDYGNPQLINCLITGNKGGVMYGKRANPSITNCTISGNSGSIFLDRSSCKIYNSIILGNGGGVGNFDYGLTCINSIVQGKVADNYNNNLDGSIDAATVFENPVANSFAPTSEGDYTLKTLSPVIDKGNNSISPAGNDIAGNNRVSNCIVDMGAYERTNAIDNPPLPVVEYFTTSYQSSVGTTNYTYGCGGLIASLSAGGNRPVSGKVAASVWAYSSGNNFVKRHYEMTPEENTATATGRLTLYFLQSEFDDFNSNTNPVKLPTSPSDLAGKSNLLIEKRAGKSSNGTGSPNSYTGTIQTIDPDDADVVWNSVLDRWEVTFDVTGFSGFFVKTQTEPLPVKLISFQVKKENTINVLTWTTSEEVNASHFEIEKSVDAYSFRRLGTVKTENLRGGSYFFTDAEYQGGILYYRLKMVDLDGTFGYSRMVSINQEVNREIYIAPNPVSDHVYVYGSSSFSGSKVVIMNLEGRVIRNIIWPAGGVVPVGGLSTGTYLLKFHTGQVLKFVKQ